MASSKYQAISAIAARAESPENQLLALKLQNAKLQRELLDLQDVERKRIARELHDGVAQTISMIKYNLEALAERQETVLPDSEYQMLLNSIAMTTNATSELRRTINDLMPVCVADSGLIDSLINLCVQFGSCQDRTSLSCDIQVSENDLPKSLKSTIFRITQEALSNAICHSGAATIKLSLKPILQGVQLTIVDDGVGFEAGQTNLDDLDLSQIGLRSMRRRARAEGGYFQLVSQPDQGCTIRCDFIYSP